LLPSYGDRRRLVEAEATAADFDQAKTRRQQRWRGQERNVSDARLVARRTAQGPAKPWTERGLARWRGGASHPVQGLASMAARRGSRRQYQPAAASTNR
jgi:hypothetical protein